MKRATRLLLVCILASPFCVAQVPAGAPAGTTGICNDGTYTSAASKRGACSGHKGVKQWYATSSTPSNTSASTPTSTPPPATPSKKTAAKSTESTSAPTGGGPGQVWLNTSSNVYHCPGTRWYGKTKAGAYMTEAEAKAKGGRPDHGKPCP